MCSIDKEIEEESE